MPIHTKFWREVLRKLSAGLVCLFFLQSQALALAPPLATKAAAFPETGRHSPGTGSEFADSYTAVAICRAVEQYGLSSGQNAISSISSWLDANPSNDVRILKRPYEITIDIPRERLAIRYFVPGMAASVTPFDDVAGLSMKLINVGHQFLCRQVISRSGPHIPELALLLERDLDQIMEGAGEHRKRHVRAAVASFRHFTKGREGYDFLFDKISNDVVKSKTPDKEAFYAALDRLHEIYEGLSQKQKDALLVAVILHDNAFFEWTEPMDHFSLSAERIAPILREYGVFDQDFISNVTDIVRYHGAMADLGLRWLPAELKEMSERSEGLSAQVLIITCADSWGKIKGRPPYASDNILSTELLEELLWVYENFAVMSEETFLEYRLRGAGMPRAYQLAREGWELTPEEFEYLRKLFSGQAGPDIRQVWATNIRNNVFPFFLVIRDMEKGSDGLERIRKLHRVKLLLGHIANCYLNSDRIKEGRVVSFDVAGSDFSDSRFENMHKTLKDEGFYELPLNQLTRAKVKEDLDRTNWSSVFGLELVFDDDRILLDTGRDTLLSSCLSSYERVAFPQNEKLGWRGEHGRPSLKDVIEMVRPYAKYRVPEFDPERYTKEVREKQYRIGLVGWSLAPEKVTVSDVKEMFTSEDARSEIERIYKGPSGKKANEEAINFMWSQERAVQGYKEISLKDHIGQEWDIMNSLLCGCKFSLDSVNNRYLVSPEAVLDLYNEYFAKDFRSLREDPDARVFIAHFLLQHDLGKRGLGEEGHERRSAAIMEEVFKKDDLGFSVYEQALLKNMVGFHAQVDKILGKRAESSNREFRRIVLEAKLSGEFSEERLVNIVRWWFLFRIAELCQGDAFAFISEGRFEAIRQSYDEAERIVRQAYKGDLRILGKVLYPVAHREGYDWKPVRRDLANSLRLARALVGELLRKRYLPDAYAGSFLSATTGHDDHDIDPVTRKQMFPLDEEGRIDQQHARYDMPGQDAVEKRFPYVSYFESLLIRYRNRYDTFRKDLERSVEEGGIDHGRLSANELGALHLLLQTAWIADGFETGNDMSKRIALGRARETESFRETIEEWLEKGYSEGYLTDRRPLEALKRLLARRDPAVLDVVRDLRAIYDDDGRMVQAGEITEEDERYMNELRSGEERSRASYNELIIVPGHGVYKGSKFEDTDKDDFWIGIHEGEGRYYTQHIEAGVGLAAARPNALLAFSGGMTREPAGRRSEAQSYFDIASQAAWWEKGGVCERVLFEDSARDSLENVLFSILAFKKETGRLPDRITVAGWEFKRERFKLHAEAVGIPRDRMSYEGVNDPEVILGGEKEKLSHAKSDMLLEGAEWEKQRSDRDPFGMEPRARLFEGREIRDIVREIRGHFEDRRSDADEQRLDIETSFTRYLYANLDALKPIIGESGGKVRLRIAVEALDSSSVSYNKAFLGMLDREHDIHIEFYYASPRKKEKPESFYRKYGVRKRDPPRGVAMARTNTITLFPAKRGEDITDIVLRERLGDLGVNPTDTVLMPVGYQSDVTGLIRGTVLGLRVMGFARELTENGSLVEDPEFLGRVQFATMEIFKGICDPSDRADLAGLSPQDMVALASGRTINEILHPLRRLIRLLPMTPYAAEQLERIYECAMAVFRSV